MPALSEYVRRTAALARARPRGWKSLLYNTAMAKARRVGPLMLPVHISIEPTNVCNLRCPVCETGNGSLARSRGMLDYEQFCRFIDDVAPHTAVLMYYFMGEPFLNKRAYDMIRYAREKGIYVETCSNGDYVDPEGLIYSDINQVSLQIGGMTQQTHEIYRVRGDLARVMRNLDRAIAERRRHPGSNVQIEVGFVVMRHNEHEVPEFLRWAREIGVDRANVIDPCVRTVEEGAALLPADRRYWFYDEDAFARGVLKPKHLPDNECTWVWNSVMVNWDGSVVPCCRDPHGKHVFGNVFERPLREIWNAPPIRDFRRRVVTAQRDVDICRLCSGYGVPALNRTRPIDFEVQRMSIDDRDFTVPLDAETIGTPLIQITR
jgi:radical SAM protein with 4Fe4S-binding SPASM domain